MDIAHENAIAVPWQTDEYGFSGKDAFLWNWKRQASRDRANAKIEQALKWPPGVIDILQTAFANNLTRKNAWDLGQISNQVDAEAFRIAAKIFRRGVMTSHCGSGKKSTQGSYLIRFLESQDAVTQAIDRADFVVVDQNVEAAWPYLEEKRTFLLFSPAEQEKNLAHVARLLAAWEGVGKPQRWLVIGGGLSSDLTGFAASLAGCQLTIMPTTLLAMVDASVGGKTGVNFPPYGKNQIGAFHFPREVLIWTGWLQTLVQRTLRSGGAECLKHALLVKNRQKVRSLAKILSSAEIAPLSKILPELINIKVNIVVADPTEVGQRAVLNLGHTMGHALEAISSDTHNYHFQVIEHGEAISVGICFAALLSRRLGLLSDADCDFVWEMFQVSQCLPSRILIENYMGTQDLNNQSLWDEILKKLLQDKKQTSSNKDRINFVLMSGIGKIFEPAPNVYAHGVTISQVRACWRELLKKLT
jgi:3-dehydroquinate synthase